MRIEQLGSPFHACCHASSLHELRLFVKLSIVMVLAPKLSSNLLF